MSDLTRAMQWRVPDTQYIHWSRFSTKTRRGQPWATRKHALNAVISGVTLVNQAEPRAKLAEKPPTSRAVRTHGSHMTWFSFSGGGNGVAGGVEWRYFDESAFVQGNTLKV